MRGKIKGFVKGLAFPLALIVAFYSVRSCFKEKNKKIDRILQKPARTIQVNTNGGEMPLCLEGWIENYKTNDFSKDSDRMLLARMIYGEARNCSDEEKKAVAYTSLTRLARKSRYGKTLKEVLLKPWQYSCFNPNDSNREKLMNPNPQEFGDCLFIAERVLSGKYLDLTNGATHYHTRQISPEWSKSLKMARTRTLEDFRHVFYRER